MQTNFKTKVAYSGANASALSHVQKAKNYQHTQWLTFLQAKELGKQVKKGEKGVKLLRVIEVENKKNKKIKEKIVRGFVVFNVEQVEIK